MKTKIFLKIMLIVLAVSIMVCMLNNIVFAASDNFDFSKIEANKADDSIKEPVTSAVGAILSVIRIVGTGIAIIILAYIGMKYMIAAPGDRADFKKGAIQYVIGAIVVFGASNILTFLIPIIESIFPST